jgi:hypothetical protein
MIHRAPHQSAVVTRVTTGQTVRMNLAVLTLPKSSLGCCSFEPPLFRESNR